uniref:Apple domain-containing protein n=1 Tax=Coccidioides posadasii RMSCC 3488 TaxID=454284 RepID=A0A0J6I586_COCPO|nr:hypothetical protein CPAG_02890 [Coccidioides posadasii RMSCC 3488]
MKAQGCAFLALSALLAGSVTAQFNPSPPPGSGNSRPGGSPGGFNPSPPPAPGTGGSPGGFNPSPPPAPGTGGSPGGFNPSPPPAPGSSPSGPGTPPAAGFGCPNPRGQFNPSPQPTTQISCPNSDGSIYEADDGTWYHLQCCVARDPNALSLGAPAASSYDQCLQECSKVDACVAATFNPIENKCQLWDFGTYSAIGQDSQLYAWVTDPPVQVTPKMSSRLCSTTCPEADGQIYVSKYGETFRMDCEKRHGTQYLDRQSVDSFEECIEACGAAPSCSSVDFDQKRNTCYLSIDGGSPTLQARTFASAHSVGCAGACDRCNDKCSTPAKKPEDPSKCTNDNAIVAASGYAFRVHCNQCLYSTSGPGVPEAKNHQECMEACVRDERCGGANWRITEGCVLRYNPTSGLHADGECTAAFTKFQASQA